MDLHSKMDSEHLGMSSCGHAAMSSGQSSEPQERMVSVQFF